MLHSFTYPDAVTMHDAICRRMMFGSMGKHFDWIGSPEVGMSNVQIGLESFDYDFNFAEAFQQSTRWRLMVRQYINPDQLDWALGMVEAHLGKKPGVKQRINQKRGIATVRLNPVDEWDPDEDDYDQAGSELSTNLVGSRKTGTRTARRWGSCMLNMTYRISPRPTVTLNSRTTYFGMLAMMDVTVAHVFGKMCNAITGFSMADTQFVWNINLAQWHGFRSLAWALTDNDARAKLEAHYEQRDKHKATRPGFYRSLTGYRRLARLDDEGVLYGDEKFASALRMRKRFHTEIHGPEYAAQFAGGTLHPDWGRPFEKLPDLWSSTLDFKPIGRPLNV